ncbi:MAG: c-type cytochrome [Prolixibacteraceae bacterium]
MKRSYLFLIIILMSAGRLFAQEWVVPAENAAKRSPFAFSDSIRQAGATLYMTNCKSCHGDPGKNNPVKLVPLPPDPASAQMQKNSDGDMFYKLTVGRGPMPSFKNTLSSTDLWRIVSFIRGYNDKYVQEVAPSLAPGSSLDQVRIVISMIKEKNQVLVSLSSLKNMIRQPVANAEVKLFARRYFGNLLIDEARTSDSQGIASFQFPANLPGDAKGFVQLIAKPTDETAFGEAKADTTLAIGLPTYRPPLNEQRALWNIVQKSPIWLLLTYVFSVLAVWGFIVYVLLQVRAIFKSGSDEEQV